MSLRRYLCSFTAHGCPVLQPNLVFRIFAELLYFLLHLFMAHCCGSEAGGEAGVTPGRTSQPTASLQHRDEQGLTCWFI